MSPSRNYATDVDPPPAVKPAPSQSSFEFYWHLVVISRYCTIGLKKKIQACAATQVSLGQLSISGWVTQLSGPQEADCRLVYMMHGNSETLSRISPSQRRCYQDAKTQTVDSEHQGWVRLCSSPSNFCRTFHKQFLLWPKFLLSLIKYWLFLFAILVTIKYMQLFLISSPQKLWAFWSVFDSFSLFVLAFLYRHSYASFSLEQKVLLHQIVD